MMHILALPLAMAVLRWLQGWGPIEGYQYKEARRRNVDVTAITSVPAWRKIAEKLRSIGMICLYLAGTLLLFQAYQGVGLIEAVLTSLAAGGLYYLGRQSYGKRILFVNWNGKRQTLLDERDNWIGFIAWPFELLPAFDWFEKRNSSTNRNYATLYGTLAGLWYGLLLFAPFWLVDYLRDDFQAWQLLALFFPGLYGVIYRITGKLLSDPAIHGETIARGPFGLAIGIGLAIVVGS